MNNIVQRRQLTPSPLPETVEDLLARRADAPKVFYNYVEQVIRELWTDVEFKRLLEGLSASETVSGSERTDDVLAAQMIQAHAEKTQVTQIVGVHVLDAVVRAMRTVLGIYQVSRRQRKAEFRSQYMAALSCGNIEF